MEERIGDRQRNQRSRKDSERDAGMNKVSRVQNRVP